MSVCMYACICTTGMLSAVGGQTRVLNLLYLEMRPLQATVQVLEVDPGFSLRTANALACFQQVSNSWAIFPTPWLEKIWENNGSRGEEIAQSVNCLQVCKWEDLNLGFPSTHINTERGGMRLRDRSSPEAHQSPVPVDQWALDAVRDPASKPKVQSNWGRHLTSISSFHIAAH